MESREISIERNRRQGGDVVQAVVCVVVPLDSVHVDQTCAEEARVAESNGRVEHNGHCCSDYLDLRARATTQTHIPTHRDN